MHRDKSKAINIHKHEFYNMNKYNKPSLNINPKKDT